jgi:hypothetical protein
MNFGRPSKLLAVEKRSLSGAEIDQIAMFGLNADLSVNARHHQPFFLLENYITLFGVAPDLYSSLIEFVGGHLLFATDFC